MESSLKRSRSPSTPLSASKRAHSQEKESSDTDVSKAASNLTIEGIDPMLESTASSPLDTTYSSSPSVPPRPTTTEQLAEISLLKQQGLNAGAEWALISRAWYRKFETVCSGVAQSKEDDLGLIEEDIGPIDNKDLINEDGLLKMPLSEGSDLVLVPKAAHDLLVSWYGSVGPQFLRKVVSETGFGDERVEFYPPTFYLIKLLPSDSTLAVSIPVQHLTPPFVSLSASTPLKALKIHISYVLDMSREIRLWRIPAGGETRLSESTKNGPSFMQEDQLNLEGTELIESLTITEDMTLREALLDSLETLLAVEEKLPNGEWFVNIGETTPPLLAIESAPSETVSKGLFSGKQFFGNAPAPKLPKRAELTTTKGGILSSVFTRSKAPMQKGQRGLTGLNNLGNTCFMNSALQCMSNTKELQEYFTSGAHHTELNRDNPLGMGGQVAEAFGQLIARIWSGNGGAVAPREFKQALSKFAPSFSGYGQQDSQELLAFLLDGIHEDLNRIQKKPATNAPDWEGGGDQALIDMAKTCWEQYRSRNDSVIVDLFQGQYRSTVVCPDCDKVSITFDPFMYITTNLPISQKWTGRVYFIPLDPAKPRYSIDLELPKVANFKQLKAAVGKFMDVEPKHLICAETWSHQFFKALYDEDAVNDVSGTDEVILFETSAPHPQPKPRFNLKKKPAPVTKLEGEEELIVVPVFNFSPKSTSSMKKMFLGGSKEELFGTPLLVTLTPTEASTEAGIYRALVTQYSRYTKLGKEMLEATDKLEALEGEDSSADEVVEENEIDQGKDLSIDGEAIDSISIPTNLDTTEDIVVDLPTPQDDMDLDRNSPTASTSTLPSEIPPPPSTSTKSTRQKPFFTIRVSKQTATEIPFTQGTVDKPNVPLAARLDRKDMSDDSDIFPSSSQTTLPGSFTISNMEGKKSADRVEPVTEIILDSIPVAESMLPTGPIPLISTGDFLITSWQSPAVEYFFEESQRTWSELEEFVDPAIKESKERKLGKKVITIEDCLNEFTKEERLGEDDTWYCPDCKKHQQATKKVEIWKVPDIIVFALKRFSSSRYSRDKLDDFVDFPVEGFNLESFVEGDKVEKRVALELAGGSIEGLPESKSLIYDLYAVDNHYGGMGGGHYTAYGKNHETGKWYDFDDSRVSPLTDPNSVKTKAAYLLFYRRRTTDSLGAKTHELVNSALASKTNSVANSEAGASRSNSRERSPPLDAFDSFGSRSKLPGYSAIPGGFTRGNWSSRSSPASDTEADNGDQSPRSNSGADDFFNPPYDRSFNGDLDLDTTSSPDSPRLNWNSFGAHEVLPIEEDPPIDIFNEPSPRDAEHALEMMDQVE